MYHEENKQSQNAGAKYQRKFVIGDCNLHEPRIFYPSGHWPETVTNAHVSAHFR